MSSSWLRLWHEMPNDPKWRTIARVSGQPISLVQAVYLHLLVDASRNVTRGHVSVTTEDLASALDVTDEQIESIISAMQGRVMDGNALSGWGKRQPKREDVGNTEGRAMSATERKRAQRARDKEKQNVTSSHEESRNVTTDTDTDTERASTTDVVLVDAAPQPDQSNGQDLFEPDQPEYLNGHQHGIKPCPAQAIADLYHRTLPELPAVALLNDTRRRHLQARWREHEAHRSLEFWQELFETVKASPFLMGNVPGRNGGKPFRATFDWIIAPSNFVKIVEGNYHA